MSTVQFCLGTEMSAVPFCLGTEISWYAKNWDRNVRDLNVWDATVLPPVFSCLVREIGRLKRLSSNYLEKGTLNKSVQ